MSSKHPSLPPFESAHDSQANWTQPQESYYIDLMADKASTKGNKWSGTFSKGEWLDMRKQYYNKFGLKHNLKSFKNKMHSLRDRCREYNKLLEGSGLKWDPALKNVVAPHSWWDDYLKKNPKAKKFRNEGCPEYEKFALIFGETVAVDEHLQGVSNQDMEDITSTDREDISNNIASGPSHTAQMRRMSSDNAPMVGQQDQQRSRSRSPINSRSRDTGGSGMSEALLRVAEASQARAALTNQYTISKCIQILDGMDVGDRAYMKALKLLQEKGWREAFICMSAERRKGWLRSIKDGDI
ncbi:hypothetical protein IFM89_002887 [Coptis chinensis]|uniref:Myb/SANT-like domain-containing protein n=1 Tax=Coptis chinensis TaxID=261450 RepID=A0A835M752_9MAGN|nr:hypothetical protein IFM89_002887 [Coptis chinensis]